MFADQERNMQKKKKNNMQKEEDAIRHLFSLKLFKISRNGKDEFS